LTEWVLICKVCGNRRVMDLGYNLFEFKELHVYCRVCGRNTPHKVAELRR